MTTNTSTAALILADGDTPPAMFDEYRTTTVLGANVRPGMVLVDVELGIPAAIVDHRIGSAGPRTGAIEYLVENLDGGPRYTRQALGARSRITVVAR